MSLRAPLKRRQYIGDKLCCFFSDEDKEEEDDGDVDTCLFSGFDCPFGGEEENFESDSVVLLVFCQFH